MVDEHDDQVSDMIERLSEDVVLCWFCGQPLASEPHPVRFCPWARALPGHEEGWAHRSCLRMVGMTGTGAQDRL